MVKCQICGARLKNDLSISRKIGPECWEKYGHLINTVHLEKLRQAYWKEKRKEKREQAIQERQRKRLMQEEMKREQREKKAWLLKKKMQDDMAKIAQENLRNGRETIKSRERIWRLRQDGTKRNTGTSQGEKIPKVIKTTAKAVAVGLTVGAVASVFQPIVPMYKAYSMIKVGKGIYDNYKKTQRSGTIFEDVFSESKKQYIGYVMANISELKAIKFSQEIRKMTVDSGLVKNIAEKTNVNEEIYASMIEGSSKNAVLSGIGNMTTYAVDAV